VSDTLRLYDLLDSPFCLKARIVLALKHVPYERVVANLSRRSELRRLNPLAKVPVLVVVGREALSDSSRIARFVEGEFPRPPLLPKDASSRAYCHLLEEWADESLYFLIGAFKWLNPANRARAYTATSELVPSLLPKRLTMNLVRRGIAKRYRAQGYGAEHLAHLQERMAENLACLSDLLADKPFLLGRFVTLADIAVFAQLAWMSGYEEKRLLEAMPLVQKWMAQLEAVEEVQEAMRGEAPRAVADATENLAASV